MCERMCECMFGFVCGYECVSVYGCVNVGIYDYECVLSTCSYVCFCVKVCGICM